MNGVAFVREGGARGKHRTEVTEEDFGVGGANLRIGQRGFRCEKLAIIFLTPETQILNSES
jgi:hypothetical protein